MNKLYSGSSMNQIYASICSDLIHEPDFVVGPRGAKTYELFNPRLVLTDTRKCITTLTGRRIDMRYLVGKLVYYLSKRTDLKSIEYYSSLWRKVSARCTIFSPSAAFELWHSLRDGDTLAFPG